MILVHASISPVDRKISNLLLQEDVNLWFHKREPGSEAEGRQLYDDDADRRHRRLPRRRDPPLRHLSSPHNLLQVFLKIFLEFFLLF